jgi:Phage integrase, N-terminal SAM-like domain
VTRLRKMMLEELQRRNYSAITTRNYLRVVSDFARHFGKSPDKLGPNELRTYQAYLLQECKLTPGTVVNRVAALRFFFVKTLKRHPVPRVLAVSTGPASATDSAQPGGSCAIDRCRGNPVSTDVADDALRHRHATQRTGSS